MLLRRELRAKQRQICSSVVGILILLSIGLIAVGSDEAAVDDGSCFFRGDMLAVPWTVEGESQLWAMIETLESMIGVPPSLDASSEAEVERFDIPADLRPFALRLAQLYFELGNAFAGGGLDALVAFERGKHWGLKGLRMDPEFAQIEQDRGFEAAVAEATDVGVLFWTCLCWLRCAEANPIMAAVSGTPAKVLSMLERCVDIDPQYAMCGPYRALAGFWGGLPDLPLTWLRRNLDLALEYSCRVMTGDPHCLETSNGPDECDRFLENRLTFVKYYLLPSGHIEDAVRILREILCTTRLPATMPRFCWIRSAKRSQTSRSEIRKSA